MDLGGLPQEQHAGIMTLGFWTECIVSAQIAPQDIGYPTDLPVSTSGAEVAAASNDRTRHAQTKKETRVRRSRRFGILPKLFITMIAVALLPLSAIWYLHYRASVERLSHDIEERLSAQADESVGYVNGWVDTHLRMLRQNASLDDIVSMNGHRQAPVLQSIARQYPWVFLAHTLGPDGMNVGRSDSEAPKDYADREYFQQAISGAPMGRQVVISKTNGRPAFILSVPITNRGLQRVGVLAVAMAIDELSRKITAVRIGNTGYAFLVDDKANVIAHPAARGNLAAHPAVVALGDQPKKKVVFMDAGKAVVAYAQKTEQGWMVVAQQDYADAYAPLQEANRSALVLLVASVVFVGLLSSLLASRLTRPIRHLTEIADEISHGRLAEEIEEVNRSDEIGGLARAIDRLKSSVAVAMKRLTGDQRAVARDYPPVVGGGATRS